jgi:TIR domain
MSSDAAIGFWSYAHDDDKLDNGLIIKLAHLIEDEYDLITGERFKLFLDQDSLAWGDAWRERVDSALLQTTFFIPIITPRYFLRPECRRELLEFSAKSSSLGVSEYLLPIIYAKPENFNRENPDKAVSLVAGIQYVDWQDLRLMDRNSHEFRSSINDMAKRLRRIANDVAERQLHHEVTSVDANTNGSDGVAELVAQIMELIPDWLGAVESDSVLEAQVEATWNTCMSRVAKLQRSHSPASAVLGAKIRTGKEMLPIAERASRASKIYLERSMQLDPLISSLARLLSSHPDSYELVTPVRSAVDEALENIHRGEETIKETESVGRESIAERLDEWRHLGRVFQQCSILIREEERQVLEGNQIVRRWDAELKINVS